MSRGLDFGISKKGKIFTLGKTKRTRSKRRKGYSFFGKPRKSRKRDSYSWI